MIASLHNRVWRYLTAARSADMLWLLLYGAAGFALFLFVVMNRSVPALRSVGIFVRYNFTLLAPGLLLLFLLLWLPGRLRVRMLLLPVTLVVFGLTLTGLWASGKTESSVVSGLLPWLDSASYYRDALRIIEGFEFSRFSSWRPIFPSLLTGLLVLFGSSLQTALIALVFLAAVSIYLLTSQVRHTHGALVAAGTLVLLFLYYRRFSGTTLSENLGLVFACLGIALLWNSAGHRNPILALAGLFGLSMALNTRPGPFFLLLFAVFWVARVFRNNERYISWKFLLPGIIVIAIPFLLNSFLQSRVNSEPTVPFGNITNAVYGVVTGGRSWTYLYEQYPEIAAMSDPERSLESLRRIREYFNHSPLDTLHGIIYNYSLLFSRTYYNIYAFVRGENAWVAEATRLSLYALAALGLLAGFLGRAAQQERLVSYLSIGVLLSVPFVPPGDAYGMRLYAAGIPLLILLPVMGLRLILSKARLFQTQTAPDQVSLLPRTAGYLLGLLTFIIILSPLMVIALRQPNALPNIACPPGEQAAAFRLLPGTFVRVIREDAWQLDWMPEFHRGRFVMQVHNLPNIEAIEEYEQMEGEFTLMNTINLYDGLNLLLSAPTGLLPEPPALVLGCGNYTANPRAISYGFFYLHSVHHPAGEKSGY